MEGRSRPPRLVWGKNWRRRSGSSSAGRAMARRRQPPRQYAFGGSSRRRRRPWGSVSRPAALGALLPAFPAEFSLPVLVVQHMPPLFTRLLAERLHGVCRLPVGEARAGQAVAAGKILIAPGDFHMKVVSGAGNVRVYLDQSAPQNSCRPAVDALFASMAEVYGGAVIAVILTGMGRDGLRGAQILRAQGASILAQDEASSVVWGMPGAVANAGLADRVLGLDHIVPEILRLAGGR